MKHGVVRGCLVAALFFGFGSGAHAQLVSTEEIAAQDGTAQREKVKEFLERAAVQDRLKTMGVEGLWAKQRVDALTDQEVTTLAQKIDAMPAGGALSNSDLIIVLLVALLVVLLV